MNSEYTLLPEFASSARLRSDDSPTETLGEFAAGDPKEEILDVDLASCLSKLLDSLVEAVEGRGPYSIPQALSAERAAHSVGGNTEAPAQEDSCLPPVASFSTSRRDFQLRKESGISGSDSYWF
jgi:hypothetical protein